MFRKSWDRGAEVGKQRLREAFLRRGHSQSPRVAGNSKPHRANVPSVRDKSGVKSSFHNKGDIAFSQLAGSPLRPLPPWTGGCCSLGFLSLTPQPMNHVNSQQGVPPLLAHFPQILRLFLSSHLVLTAQCLHPSFIHPLPQGLSRLLVCTVDFKMTNMEGIPSIKTSITM